MNTQLIAREYQVLSEVDSTNSTLKEMATQQNLPEGFCLLSNYQRSGRGQYGKDWESSPGQNLLMSLFLKPNYLPASESYRLTMSVCLALWDLGNELGLETCIKWPNDWLIENRKLAGVLAESNLRGPRMETCIVGIGINVLQKEFPYPNASSLSLELKRDPEIMDLFSQFATHLDFRYAQLRFQQWDSQHREFEQILYGKENFVPVLRNGEKLYLRCVGVKPDGELLVVWKGGRRETLRHQDVKFLLQD